MSSIMKEQLLCITRWGHKLSGKVCGTTIHVYSWGAYGAHNYWDHAKDGMDQNLLTCWKHHMDKMDNIQNNGGILMSNIGNIIWRKWTTSKTMHIRS